MVFSEKNLNNFKRLKTNTLLSVIIPTFNHSKFIAQTIEGCLSQQTNFEFELLIGDDASTDKNHQIIKEYSQKYPQKIKAFLHNENLGPQNPIELAGKNNVKFLFSKAKSPYLAICEGDDYWTDPTKIQQQVEFLENNQAFNLCHHQTKIVFEDGTKSKNFNDWQSEKEYLVSELLADNWVIATTSAVFRNNFINGFDNYFERAISGDWAIFFQTIAQKKIYYNPNCMGVYRKHQGGVTNILTNKNRFYLENRIQLFEELKEHFYPYRHIIQQSIENYKAQLRTLN